MIRASMHPADPKTGPVLVLGPSHVFVLLLSLVIGVIVRNNYTWANDPLVFMIPNFLLFTPFRDLTQKAWEKFLVYDKSQVYEPAPIPEVRAEDFSYEVMRQMTSNWRYPVVVRGMFKDSVAVQRWHEPGYLDQKIGHHNVTMLERGDANNLENDRDQREHRFSEAYNYILENEGSPKYLFFPRFSRFSKEELKNLAAINALKKAVNELISEDLGLDRIWPGFGSKRHRTFAGTQFIAGWGNPDMNRTTGSNWHCAPGNNWFVQVHGVKRWYFLDTKYSSYLQPQRDGINTMATASRDMINLQNHLPVKFVDMQAGDMIYNPDFEWHLIRNHAGLSIGLPIREFNWTLALRNNKQYFGIIAINNALSWLGLSYGLMPHLSKKKSS